MSAPRSVTGHALTVLDVALTRLAAAERAARRARATVGETITDRRRALNLTGAQVARLAQVNASELSKLERGTIAYRGGIAERVDATLSAIEAERAERVARIA